VALRTVLAGLARGKALARPAGIRAVCNATIAAGERHLAFASVVARIRLHLACGALPGFNACPLRKILGITTLRAGFACRIAHASALIFAAEAVVAWGNICLAVAIAFWHLLKLASSTR